MYTAITLTSFEILSPYISSSRPCMLAYVEDIHLMQSLYASEIQLWYCYEFYILGSTLQRALKVQQKQPVFWLVQLKNG